MFIFFRSILLSIIFFSLNNTKANDGWSGEGLGGVVLTKTDDVALVKEVLEVSYKNIAVYYEFLNESDKTIKSTMSFPIPIYGISNIGPSRHIYAAHPSNFKILVNGKHLPFNTKIKVEMDPDGGSYAPNFVDITDKLINMGLDLRKIAEIPFKNFIEGTHPDLEHFFTKKEIENLKKAGLIYDVKDGIFADNDDLIEPRTQLFDRRYVADWFIRVVYEWKYEFKPHELIIVQHNYQPFRSYKVPFATSGSNDTGCSISESNMLSLKKCMPDKDHELLQKVCKRLSIKDELLNYHLKELYSTEVKYILVTANSWKDGIRDFTLRINKELPNQLIMTCFPANFQQINELTFEAKIKNFKPDQDLTVEFFNLTEFDIDGPPENAPIFYGE